MKIFPYGGGVQSTASLVLASQGKIDFQTFLFCNVGDDSENPETLKYVHSVAMPYAKEHGIEVIELQRTRFGEAETLYGRLTRPGTKSIGIPVRMGRSGMPANRACTGDFKIKVIAKWLREHGATKENPATAGIGISLDEFQRMRSDSGIAWQKLAYPLIDLRMDRQQCMNVISQAGLPVPPKSSCWFCPFHSLRAWQEMRQEKPEQFQKACELEQLIIDRMDAHKSGDAAYFTRKLKPLAMATSSLTQESLFENEDICDSGYCFV